MHARNRELCIIYTCSRQYCIHVVSIVVLYINMQFLPLDLEDDSNTQVNVSPATEIQMIQSGDNTGSQG